MRVQRLFLSFFIAGTLASVTGCAKSEADRPSQVLTTYTPSSNTIARVHWLGEVRLGITANAFYFMRLWELPITAKLKDQTLAKLSTAPWRLQAGTTASRDAGDFLRPLLNDIVWDECYFEVHQPDNQPAECVFAIKLSPDRAGIWETNLAIVLKSLTGTGPSVSAADPHGWTLQRMDTPNRVELTHSGEWTIISVAPDNHVLREEIQRWIHSDPVSGVGAGTNNWLEAEADLQKLAAVLPASWDLPANLPIIFLAINGDGANVLTSAQLRFPQALSLQLAPWNFPVGLVPEPFDSLTAVRGLQPWLGSLKVSHQLPLDPLPNQLYFWSLPGAPSQAYFAAPVSDASNQVNRMAEYLLQQSNPWLAARGYVSFGRAPDSNGVLWGTMPSIQPFMRSANAAAGDFVFGGLLPKTDPGTNTQDNLFPRPSFPGLTDRIAAQSNLVYYDWELTGSRIEPCLYLGQVSSVVSRHTPLALDTFSVTWLKTIESRLGPSTTTVIQTGPDQLSFSRKSTTGFTGAELQLLADWFESPQFPHGLYSILTQPPAQP
jgi:hypothetical protein